MTADTNRKCIKCHIVKPLNKNNFRHARVYKGRVYLTRACKKCTPNYSRHTKKYQNAHPERCWITKTVTCAMRRSKTYGIPFERVEVQRLAEKHTHGTPCPCCMTPMTYFNNGTRKTWASLDRIQPLKGYVAGNMTFICYRCNLLKSNGTIEEFQNVLNYMKGQQHV